ncbi:GTPase [Nostoc sp. 'Peltigera membranacea cyanobiont' 232]|uniref:GTPase n=1 Tax=Nostoc sp. 'Peltigera membranacea cyanobiont' 232 TaxID=2014531 RepID=UPI001671CEE7|nr:GTPase [Nostoc sp. 'Peltigera membranacea cyanobiont' 232]
MVDELRQRLEQAKGKTFTFLLIGKTGVGKSSTINSLMGTNVAPVGDFDPCTINVNIYDTDLNEAIVRVIDTPGLCDDIEEAGNDAKYIELIRQNIPYAIDAVLFVSRLDDSRVDASEKRGLRLITEAFGELFWKKSVIVFTCSDKVPNSRFEEYLSERTKRIHAALSALKLSNDTVHAIPSVAVDNTNLEKLNPPDGEKWIQQFYCTVLDRIENNDSKDVFVLSTSHTALSAAMRYIIKAESYDRKGARGKLYCIIAGSAVWWKK